MQQGNNMTKQYDVVDDTNYKVDKGHVSPERARELVDTSPNLSPIRGGFKAEPLVQFKEGEVVEGGNTQHSEGHMDMSHRGLIGRGYESNEDGTKFSLNKHVVTRNKKDNSWHHTSPAGKVTTGNGHTSLMNHLNSVGHKPY